MLTTPSLSTLALAALALSSGGAQGALAQDNGSWQPSSSSHAWSASASGTTNASRSAGGNGTAVATASSASSTSTPSLSGSNPLIPSTLSSKCSTFLTTLNSDPTLATCTTPLLSALSAFLPSSSLTSYTSSTGDISSALSALCSPTSTAACSDSSLRSTLTQFQGNCSAELNQKNEVVLGLYDTLYVFSPLRTAVCTTDAAGGWCLTDIVAGRMPVGSTGANATAVATSSVASSASAAAASASASLNASQIEDVSGQDQSANLTSPTKLNTLAASEGSKPSIDIPAPPSLYIQISGAVKRFVRRQQQWGSSEGGNGGNGGGEGSSSFSSSSASASPSSSGNGTASASASSSANATAEDQSPAAADSHSAFQNYSLPSLLPSSSTWRQSNLPFLFLTPSTTNQSSSSSSSSFSSTTLCSSCTKSILASYVAFESRLPYFLGLANSPLLGGQGGVWKGVGEVCGSGFLEAAAREAGQANLTGGAGAGAVVKMGGVVAAVFVAVVAVLA